MCNTLHWNILLATAFAAVGCSSDTTPAPASGHTGGAKGSNQTSSTSASGGTTGLSAGGSSSSSSTKSPANGGTTSSSSSNGSANGGTNASNSDSGANKGGASNAQSSGKQTGGASTINSAKIGGSGQGVGGMSSVVAPAGGKPSGDGGRGPAAAGVPGRGGAPTEGGAPLSAAGAAAGGDTTAGGSNGVTVQLAQTRQTIEGFGINDTWQALSDAQAKALFDPTTGLGLTILRIGMKPDKTGVAYNNNEESSISAAKKYGAKTIIGSVWSPPPECKNPNTGKTVNGGHLISSCYESWSDAIVTFAKKYSLYAMSAGNEPDFASCGTSIGPPCTVDYDTTVFTAKEMVDWVKVLGPKLKAANIKLISPEASEWIHIWSNISATGSTVAAHPHSSDPLKCGCFDANTPCASTCLEGNGYDYGHWLYKDKDAWAAVDILGVHQYDTQVAEPWPADVPDKKPVWQTEMSGVKYWPEGEPSKDINNGIAVAGWLHNALTAGEANAWLWWWYKGQDTNEGLYLSDNSDTKRHYTFGNYTRYIRPGYVRVEVAGNVPANVSLSAYKGTDGTVVVVAINKATSAATVPIGIVGDTTPASCTPNVTSASEDLVAKAAVTVTNGTLSASLAASSVTTFVCK